MANEQAGQVIRINLRVVLVLVIIACAALAGFTKLWLRATRFPVITRGPLHPLTPPITADKIALMADLRARNYEKLDTALSSFQAAAERDVTQETNMVQAFEAFSRADPTFDAPLQEWVSRSPDSYAAHLARAEFLDREGWDARGGRTIDKTSDEQIQRMSEYLASSREEALSALRINPKLAEAYAVLIGQVRTSGVVESCVRANDAGLKQVPASFAIRRATMSCLRPRWGGSYRAMDLLSRQTEPYVHENPQLAALKGFADLDRGEVLSDENNYEAGIAYYTRAIAEGGDYWSFYYQRGIALTNLNRYGDGLEDLFRANQLMPQSPDVLSWIAYGLFATGKTRDALNQLNLATEIKGPWPYEQQLRGQIVAALSVHSRDAGASGN